VAIIKLTWILVWVPENATGFEQSDAVANFCKPTVVMLSGGSGLDAFTAMLAVNNITTHVNL
jgi:hypothetical protein